jgi:hypothetical protein
MYAGDFGVLVPERLLVVVELILFETMFLKDSFRKAPVLALIGWWGMQG